MTDKRHPLTDKQHPMLPTNEQLVEWDSEYFDQEGCQGERQNFDFMMIKAFQAGADCRLEQVIEWLEDYTNTVEFLKHPHYVVTELKKAMRPQEES